MTKKQTPEKAVAREGTTGLFKQYKARDIGSKRDCGARFVRLFAATTFLTPLSGQALAQDASSPPTGTQDAQQTSGSGTRQPEEGLQDIIVTATRRQESAQRVPMSIQALGAEKLAERQVTSFADYANLVPSLSFQSLGPGRSEPFFRGISVKGSSASTVGLYLDEIPITTAGGSSGTRSRMPDPHIYDIERLEALSGPQGTLFGANSLAGTIRIITNKPDPDKFEAGYDAQVNKFGDGDFGGMLEGFANVPVTEGVAVRLMGYWKKDGGYIDNRPASHTFQLGDDDPSTTYTKDNSHIAKKDYNPNTEYGGRAALRIDLDDNWTVTPSITGQYQSSEGGFNYDPDIGDLAVHDFNPSYNKDRWYQASLTIEGKIGDFDIVSATGYFRRKIHNVQDYTYYTVTYDDFGPGLDTYLMFRDPQGNFLDPVQKWDGRANYKYFTQEFRVSTPNDWFLHGTAGVFYQDRTTEFDNDLIIAGLSTATVGVNMAPSTAVKGDDFYLVQSNGYAEDFGVFAEGSIDISNAITLTGGIRYFDARTRGIGFSGTYFSALNARRAVDMINNKPGCADILPLATDERLTCVNFDIPYRETGETHKASLSWKVDSDKMVYATYSTGFRPGGGNTLPGSPPFKADTLSNYEVGFKTEWGGKFRLNGAFYYEVWNGVQYPVFPIGFSGVPVTVNAGDAEVKGIELNADLHLGPITLSTSGAYNDAQLTTNFCNLDPILKVVQLATCTTPESTAAAKGTRLPRQPKLKMQGSIRYDARIGKYDIFTQGVGYFQTNSTSALDARDNALLGNTRGFASFDFSVGAKLDDFTIEAFIQNAFDKRGQLSKNTFCPIIYCSGSSRTYPIKPQFFGLKFGQRF